MRVLKYHQHRPAARERFELMQQRLEQFLALALRAQIEIRSGIWQRQQLGQQLDLIIPAGAGCEQSPQLAEFLLSPLVAREAGGAFDLGDERVKRAVMMVRRAEITQPGVRLARDCLRQCHGEARLADPGLPRKQHHAPFAIFRLLPAPKQQVDLFVAPYQRRCLGA